MSKTVISWDILYPPLSPHPQSRLFLLQKAVSSMKHGLPVLRFFDCLLVLHVSGSRLQGICFLPVQGLRWGWPTCCSLVLLLAFLKIGISVFFQLWGLTLIVCIFSCMMATQSHQLTLLAPLDESPPVPGVWINTLNFADESVTSYLQTASCPNFLELQWSMQRSGSKFFHVVILLQ